MRHLAVALAAVSALGAATSAGAQEVVTFGHSAPLTGPQAPNGKDNENGARLAIEELNKENINIGGKTITFKLDSQDDQADPKVRAGRAESRRSQRARRARAVQLRRRDSGIARLRQCGHSLASCRI